MWQPIETAPRDGSRILVWFVPHGAVSVVWDDPEAGPDSEWAIWCVDDFKYDLRPVRGYRIGDDTHWMPLPYAPEVGA